MKTNLSLPFSFLFVWAVVDMEDTNFMPVKMLKQEVKNTLLSGAAIFFPDRQTRRNQLFAMMVSY